MLQSTFAPRVGDIENSQLKIQRKNSKVMEKVGVENLQEKNNGCSESYM